jgi:hypothetical protein
MPEDGGIPEWLYQLLTQVGLGEDYWAQPSNLTDPWGNPVDRGRATEHRLRNMPFGWGPNIRGAVDEFGQQARAVMQYFGGPEEYFPTDKFVPRSDPTATPISGVQTRTKMSAPMQYQPPAPPERLKLPPGGWQSKPLGPRGDNIGERPSMGPVPTMPQTVKAFFGRQRVPFENKLDAMDADRAMLMQASRPPMREGYRRMRKQYEPRPAVPELSSFLQRRNRNLIK